MGYIEMPSSRKRSGGLPDKNSDQKRFLEAFGLSGSIQEAARLANVHWQAHYDWLQEDPTYRERFRQARMWAVQTLEDEAFRRALKGVNRPVLYKGKPVFVGGQMMYETEYSDQLLITLLKANSPDKYRERTENLQFHKLDPSQLSDAMLEKLADFYLKSALGTDDPAAIAEARKQLEAAPVVSEAPAG